MSSFTVRECKECRDYRLHEVAEGHWRVVNRITADVCEDCEELYLHLVTKEW